MNKGVYKIINPDGEIFIGVTLNLNNTLRKFNNGNKIIYDFIKCLRSGNVPKLYYSYWKYGFKKHKIEILEELKLGDNVEDKLKYYTLKIDCRLNKNCNIIKLTK